MTTRDDDDGLFDAETISAVVEEHGVGGEELATALDRHQESVEELPGVENLAYEWRKQYESPLVERTETAYYFAVPARVWDEFAEALDVGEAMADALGEVHRRTVAAQTEADPHPTDAVAYVALDRTVDA